MSARKGPTKAERVAAEVARAVSAGRPVAVETVDFSDAKRPKTCLEVDFPILPVNQVATIEGNAGKPIYQMSKWWARRRSSVFRSMLLAAAMKAPDDPAEAAKAVWNVYYANHQKKGALSDLKVADLFMGGGTTVVEGARLGMQMYGIDLNPVAWFVVKNELAQVSREEIEALFADVEAEVKPQIMPFYACDGPHGEKGKWTRISTNEVMDEDFDALALTPEERPDYRYEGPETVYTFWAKHGPCQVTGCGHRTPIMSTPIVSVKTLTVKAWPYTCSRCGERYDIEETEARMAPDAPLVISDSEEPFSVRRSTGITCPACGNLEPPPPPAGKAQKRKVDLTLLVHPEWLRGASSISCAGERLGGTVTDNADATAAWNRLRADQMRLIEVRGTLPDEVVCPDTGAAVRTGSDGGTVPKKSAYACSACGTVQDVLTTVKASGTTAPSAAYVTQAYSAKRHREGAEYGGRYFAPAADSRAIDAASAEWERRKDEDLADYWPRAEVPYGFMTGIANGDIRTGHGFTHWWTMFNPRQLLVHTQLLRAIEIVGGDRHRPEAREYVLGAFQQYLRNQNMFCFWNPQRDSLEPMFSNANFHPKSTVVENGVFSNLGRGNWASCVESALDALDWTKAPWELVSNERLSGEHPELTANLSGKSDKVRTQDPVSATAEIHCGSATDLQDVGAATFDLVITDPPFGGLLHYSELSDFFYVWLRRYLEKSYPEEFGADHTPKSLEAVSNRARQPNDPDAFYQRLLTASWVEAHRTLKPGGILAFTFHHSEDAPWVSVLESLFDAGFYLEATYPIRSDETKGKGEFGSRKIEYDIIHVCRKRTETPQAVSWAKMRRQVLQDVRQLQKLLEHHQNEGLPEADLQVIRRGKALEYFSHHYGQVYVDEGKPISVLDALVGINQLLDEEMGVAETTPPVAAEPFTRQFLRLFDGISELPRDQMQKFLRGTGSAPSDFEARGWCEEKKKVFHLTPPIDIARTWQGRHRRGMTTDYDQAMFLVGACFANSGISATDTVSNENFRAHPALASLLDWFATRGADQPTRTAAARARTILRSWQAKQRPKSEQLGLFAGDGDESP